jgi:hypothetical protein
VSINVSDFDTSLLRTRLRCCFEIQTTWQSKWTNFSLVLDWSQLCILPARQSYFRQYGKNGVRAGEGVFWASFSVVVLPSVRAERVETIRQSFVRSPHKSVRPYGMTYEIAWSDTDGFLFVGFCEGQYQRPPAADSTTRVQATDQRPVQTLVRKFSTTCGRRLNIGSMLLEPLLALTLNFINDKLLFLKLFQLVFQLYLFVFWCAFISSSSFPSLFLLNHLLFSFHFLSSPHSSPCISFFILSLLFFVILFIFVVLTQKALRWETEKDTVAVSLRSSIVHEAPNLLGCTAVFLIECRSTFQRYVLPPSSGRVSCSVDLILIYLLSCYVPRFFTLGALSLSQACTHAYIHTKKGSFYTKVPYSAYKLICSMNIRNFAGKYCDILDFPW